MEHASVTRSTGTAPTGPLKDLTGMLRWALLWTTCMPRTVELLSANGGNRHFNHHNLVSK